MSRLRKAAVVALALLASGCGLFGDQPPPPPCPRISVPPDAQSITRFVEGPGRDLIDVAYDGRIVDILGSCEHEIDDVTNAGVLSVEINLVIETSRGPANSDRRAALDYFVALADSSRNLLNVRVFPVTVEFPGNRNRLIWRDDPDEPVILRIPLKAGQSGVDFEIFVGLQLTREELDYNYRRAKVR